MKIFLSKECLACQQITKAFPNQDFLFVEDKVNEVKQLGLVAVPAIVEENGIILYGDTYINQKLNPLIDDEIPF
jgi:hypothetical protein